MTRSKRISELPTKTNLADGDLIGIVDTDGGSQNYISKKTTILSIKTLAQVVADAQIALQKNQPNGLATIDAVTGKIPVTQLPALAINDTFVVASAAAMTGLTAQTGDVAIRTDISKSFILAAEPASTLANWLELLASGIPSTPGNNLDGGSF